jgi:hypothetical protein
VLFDTFESLISETTVAAITERGRFEERASGGAQKGERDPRARGGWHAPIMFNDLRVFRDAMRETCAPDAPLSNEIGLGTTEVNGTTTGLERSFRGSETPRRLWKASVGMNDFEPGSVSGKMIGPLDFVVEKWWFKWWDNLSLNGF